MSAIAEHYPDGVEPAELNAEANSAADRIVDEVGSNNQEAYIGIFLTPDGNLVQGEIHTGPIFQRGEIANMGQNFGTADLMNGAPGELVGVIHNHPSYNSAPSTGDEAFVNQLFMYYGDQVSNNLVQFIAVVTFSSVQAGSSSFGPVTRVTAHTEGGSADVTGNSCNG